MKGFKPTLISIWASAALQNLDCFLPPLGPDDLNEPAGTFAARKVALERDAQPLLNDEKSGRNHRADWSPKNRSMDALLEFIENELKSSEGYIGRVAFG